MAMQPMNQRQTQILAKLTQTLKGLWGSEFNERERQSPFLALGLDSLFLIQLSTAIKSDLHVDISFRQMAEEINTFDRLVAYIDQHAPASVFATAAPVAGPAPITTQPLPVAPTPTPTPVYANGSHTNGVTAHPPLPPTVSMPPMPSATGNGTQSGLEAIITQQLHLMSMQLQLLQERRSSGTSVVPIPSPTIATPLHPEVIQPPHPRPVGASVPQVGEGTIDSETVPPLTRGRAGGGEPDPKPFGAIARINTARTEELTPAQQTWLADFIAAYNARTAKSKAFTSQHHPYMADPRVVTGFKRKLKELVYPIVADHTAGCHIWDLDGNEYVDALNGFGSNFFGYAHPKITQAVVDQLWKGAEIGPQCPLSGEVAKMICDFTGLERVGFCNTGSEATLAAMRMARTVTGRRLIVTFTDSYHGVFDEVLVRGNKPLRSTPAVPGVMASSVENILVLEYDSEESLQILRERGHELAAVMVEPIQTRRPERRPHAFLRAVRRITAESGTALIFDEVVTGFRMGPGGAQAFFGIQADLAAYGKVIGGGLSIGIVAGARRFMDALDGGAWHYGDDSAPEAAVTYFAGTFVRHPATMAACKAALAVLQAGGQALYDRVNGQTARIVAELQAFFAQVGAPLTVAAFASVFRVTYTETPPYGELLFYLIRQHGVHIYDGFPCYLSLAHTDADVAKIIAAFKASVLTLQQVGFLPGTPHAISQPAPATTEEWQPLSYVQKQYMVSATTEEQAFVHEGSVFSLRGNLDVAALERACQALIRRHDALRLAVEWREGEWMQRVRSHPTIRLALVAGEGWSPETLLNEIQARWRRTFDLSQELPVRLYLFRHAPEEHTLLLLYHHVAIDGWSMAILQEELQHLYAAEVGSAPAALPALPWSFADHLRWERTMLAGAEGEQLWRYWQGHLAGPLPLLHLPTDHPRPANFSHRGDRYAFQLAPALSQRLQESCQQEEVTPYMLMLAALQLLLHHVSGQPDLLVGTMALNRMRPEHRPLVGSLVDVSVLRSTLTGNEAVRTYLQKVRQNVWEMLSHPGYPYLLLAERLLPQLEVSGEAQQPPMVQVVFNWEDGLANVAGSAPANAAGQPPALTWAPLKVPVVGSWEDYFLMYVERNADGLAVTVTYNNDLFEKNTIVQLMQGYQSLLAAMVDNLRLSSGRSPAGTVAALLAALGDPLTNRLHAEAQKDASYAELV